MRISLFAVCIIVALSGCVDDKLVAITDGSIYSKLSVRYDKTTDLTYATAEFWSESPSGKRLIFNGNATLTFQDYRMDYRSADYTYYKELLTFYSAYTFKFVDVNNKTFINTVSINPIDFSPSQVTDTVDSEQPLTIAWTGPSVGNLENVSLRIEGFTATQDTAGKTSITFSKESFAQLSAFKNKTVTMRLERSKSPGLSMDLGGGGIITLQYVSSVRNVYLR